MVSFSAPVLETSHSRAKGKQTGLCHFLVTGSWGSPHLYRKNHQGQATSTGARGWACFFPNKSPRADIGARNQTVRVQAWVTPGPNIRISSSTSICDGHMKCSVTNACCRAGIVYLVKAPPTVSLPYGYQCQCWLLQPPSSPLLVHLG